MFNADVPNGVIFAGKHRRRYNVIVDSTLEQRTRTTIHELRELLREGSVPPPVNDTRCRRCSLHSGCMPDAGFHPTTLFTPHPLGKWDD
ncbi:Dna2/Cas4 domain-containing protein [Saccharopolyspora hirsuta]|uniref:CRISPR-associated protein Cas4 n=1 Tax=Saccharopolyspora hirsuta TaxID=1837 RepID=UPI002482DF6E|nr:Dna2/Cas4 domain-containing protein [Saccharopolyspora hirsuta]